MFIQIIQEEEKRRLLRELRKKQSIDQREEQVRGYGVSEIPPAGVCLHLNKAEYKYPSYQNLNLYLSIDGISSIFNSLVIHSINFMRF